MLKAIKNAGFQMTFNNGVTISVMFGSGNYCQNRETKQDADVIKSTDAEIAMWDKDDNWYDFSSGKFDSVSVVKGWVSANEAAKYIALAALF